jgi:hypothetical protein
MSLLTIGDQFPAYRLTALIGGDLSKVMRFAQMAGVDRGSLALPLSRYPKMTGLTEASNA